VDIHIVQPVTKLLVAITEIELTQARLSGGHVMKIYQIFYRAFVFVFALLIGTTTVIGLRFVLSTVAAVTKPAGGVTERQIQLPEPLVNNLVAEVDAFSEQAIADDFDPTGSYLLDVEKVPKAFSDIRFIDITTREYKGENGKYSNIPVVPSGSVFTSRSIEFKKIAVSDREIAFETEVVDGISYKFVGQFSSSSEVITCEACEYPADLQGRLTKLRNGKVVAELSANFYIDGC